MSLKKVKGGLALLGIAGVATILAWGALIKPPMPPASPPRLVSVMDKPSQICEWEPWEGSTQQVASLHPQSLFAALLAAAPFQETSDPYFKDKALDSITAITRPPDSRTL